jgi:hypothetical protein
MELERLLGTHYKIYERSVHKLQEATFALVRRSEGQRLFLSESLPGFSGEALTEGGFLCPLTVENAFSLKQVFSWLSPRRTPGGEESFGFGDRLGLATPGHIRALAGAKVFPILVQQSVRENARTGRTFEEVLAKGIFGAFQEGYEEGFGADADHLKRIKDALHAADLGYTFFTCDPGDHVVASEALSSQEIQDRFTHLPESETFRREYLGPSFKIDGLGTLRFSEEQLARAAVKYGRAVAFATRMYQALVERLPEGFDYEVSVDETETPTTPLEHLFVAHELRRRGVDFVSLAPRFVGAMEKGVDWRGDLEVFRKELEAHAAIARDMGSYRLSLHSGSDKFTLYPLLAEETNGLWHVKTAGTSYLVALEVAAHRAPALFREIASFSISQFAHEQASYHISADPSRIPPLETVSDDELPKFIEEHNGRQVLHVAFGSVLQSPLGDELRLVLDKWEEEHYERLAQHLGRHLEGLGVKNGG